MCSRVARVRTSQVTIIQNVYKATRFYVFILINYKNYYRYLEKQEMCILECFSFCKHRNWKKKKVETLIFFYYLILLCHDSGI